MESGWLWAEEGGQQPMLRVVRECASAAQLSTQVHGRSALTGENIAVSAIDGGRDHDATALGFQVICVELPAAVLAGG